LSATVPASGADPGGSRAYYLGPTCSIPAAAHNGAYVCAWGCSVSWAANAIYNYCGMISSACSCQNGTWGCSAASGGGTPPAPTCAAVAANPGCKSVGAVNARCKYTSGATAWCYRCNQIGFTASWTQTTILFGAAVSNTCP
jgi:hypothetical protein